MIVVAIEPRSEGTNGLHPEAKIMFVAVPIDVAALANSCSPPEDDDFPSDPVRGTVTRCLA